MLANDLCKIDDVKLWLNLGVGTDDATLDRLITGVSEFIRTVTHRNFDVETYSESRSGVGWNQRRIVPKFLPIIAVNSLTIDGVTIPAVPGNVYTPGAIGYIYTATHISLFGYLFTKGMDNIVINYSAGYSTLPPDLTQAAIELVCFRYREKDRIGHKSKTLSGETVAFVTDEVPASVMRILNEYKRVIPVV